MPTIHTGVLLSQLIPVADSLLDLGRSPAVILTNLLETHQVLFLELESTDPLKFKFLGRKFTNFNQALGFALTMGQEGKGYTIQFARPPTPIQEEDV